MVSDQAFKRINFFHGFLTRVEDWQAAQSYELDKRKLHNRALHGPGVVPRMEPNRRLVEDIGRAHDAGAGLEGNPG